MGVGVCICNALTCVLGAYYRVDREIIDRVVDELQNNVLSKMPFVDLSKMKVNLIRADGNKFCAIAGSKLEGVLMQIRVITYL